MRRRDGEYARSETREFEFDGSYEERGQSWPEDVPRHVGSPNEEGFGQDWPSDVPGSASQPLVEDGAPRGFGNVEQVLAIATERGRASRTCREHLPAVQGEWGVRLYHQEYNPEPPSGTSETGPGTCS